LPTNFHEFPRIFYFLLKESFGKVLNACSEKREAEKRETWGENYLTDPIAFNACQRNKMLTNEI